VQQRIGRVRTVAGADLAWAEVVPDGSAAPRGRPLLVVSGWLGHLGLSWDHADERAFLEGLARGGRLLRYDRAGCGLSGPPVSPPSLAAELDQVDAVADAAGGTLDVVGISLGAPVAAAWAAAHPDRVGRLVLYGGWADGTAIAAPAVRDHLLGLITAHWGLGSDVLTEIFAPDTGAAARAGMAAYQRASSDAATARALLELSYRIDVRGELGAVRAPTLVVHREGDRAAPLAQARALADGIPGAQLLVLPGRSHLPHVGDTDALVAAIRRFLGRRALRSGTGPLTPRQREVAALIGSGATNREIAERLGIEERSAEGHAERIRARLGLRSRAQIAAWWAAQPDAARK
jgi:pimeloyl-ACP methyl ester carboxylesterase